MIVLLASQEAQMFRVPDVQRPVPGILAAPGLTEQTGGKPSLLSQVRIPTSHSTVSASLQIGLGIAGQF